MAKRGGKSHYGGPGKGKEGPVAKSRMQLKAAKSQAGHGKTNPNPGVPSNQKSVHRMTF